MDLLEQTIRRIRKPDQEAMAAAAARQDSMAVPRGSLGKLEKCVVQIAGIQQTADISIEKKALVIMCADNGVIEEGVSQSGCEVTAAVAENFLDEKSCVAIMCRQAGVSIFPIDIGMKMDTPRVEKRKIRHGTANMTKGPAMTRQEAAEAIAVGIRLVEELQAAGYELLATGEMGIGNTTTSSAMTSVFLEQPVELVTGRGAGLSREGLDRKVRAIRKAIAVNGPDREDPLDVLSKVGGLDIAGLTGVFLGGAACGIPVVIDGFISAVAALTAMRLAPETGAYMIASHLSGEPAAKMLLDALGKEAFLTCDLRLGEGSGAVALFPILDFASAIYHRMSSFQEASIETYEHFTD